MGLSSSDLSRLSPAAQKQVIDKLSAKQRQKEHKYHNQPTEVRGIRFDSKKEAERYRELICLLRAGEILDLKLQVDFTLQEAFTTQEGERVPAIRYRADFVYERKLSPDKYGQIIWLKEVEDVKGVKTDKYRIKKKMMQEKYGITIKEV